MYTNCVPARSKRGLAAASIALASAIWIAGCGTGNAGRNSPSAPSSQKTGAASASQAFLGYAWDSSVGGLRIMFGVPGAARLSNQVVNQEAFASAVPCMRKGYALLTNSAGNIYVISAGGLPLQISPPVLKDQRVAVSPSCATALVYAAGASNGVLITGLPSSPELQSLNFALSGPLVGAAVGDLGDVLLASYRRDGSIPLQILSSDGHVSDAFSVVKKLGALAFLPGGDSVLFADAEANSVAMVLRASTSPSLVPLASSKDGVSRPLALASSADGLQAFVANGSGVALLRLSLAQPGANTTVACTCAPSELIPLPGNSVFQVNELSSGTIYLLDANRSVPRTVFVPAAPKTSPSGAAQ